VRFSFSLAEIYYSLSNYLIIRNLFDRWIVADTLDLISDRTCHSCATRHLGDEKDERKCWNGNPANFGKVCDAYEGEGERGEISSKYPEEDFILLSREA